MLKLLNILLQNKIKELINYLLRWGSKELLFMSLIGSVQFLMEQTLLSNEQNIYLSMCKLNLHTDLINCLKILNIHKNILYARLEKNGYDIFKIYKSLESFIETI